LRTRHRVGRHEPGTQNAPRNRPAGVPHVPTVHTGRSAWPCADDAAGRGRPPAPLIETTRLSYNDEDPLIGRDMECVDGILGLPARRPRRTLWRSRRSPDAGPIRRWTGVRISPVRGPSVSRL